MFIDNKRHIIINLLNDNVLAFSDTEFLSDFRAIAFIPITDREINLNQTRALYSLAVHKEIISKVVWVEIKNVVCIAKLNESENAALVNIELRAVLDEQSAVMSDIASVVNSLEHALVNIRHIEEILIDKAELVDIFFLVDLICKDMVYTHIIARCVQIYSLYVFWKTIIHQIREHTAHVWRHC